jgi:hypothetical protein
MIYFKNIVFLLASSILMTLNAQVNSFTPTDIIGGMGKKLSIVGTGFGASQSDNYVSFFQDNGQYSDANTSKGFKYLSWTDTKIEIEMPTAFSGKLRVNINGTEYYSADTLHVKANLVYRSANPLVYDYLSNTNNKGGYTWYMHATYWNNPLAKKAIEDVFAEFRCKTGVNYILAPNPSSSNFSLNDTINLIAPDPGLGAVGYNERLWTSCILGSETFFNIRSQDLRISDKQDWYFGTGKAPAGKTKFRYVLFHELGHSLGLGHVNELGQSMYPSVSLLPSDQWSERDSITIQEKEAISHFINLSKSFSFRACGVLPLDNNKDCKNVYGLKTDIKTPQRIENLAVYPNPVSSELTINYPISERIQLRIFDLQGRLVLNTNFISQEIDITGLNTGIYLLLLTDGSIISRTNFIKI